MNRVVFKLLLLATCGLCPSVCPALEQFTQLQTYVKLEGKLTVSNESSASDLSVAPVAHYVLKLDTPTSFKGFQGQADFHGIKEIEIRGPKSFSHLECGGKQKWSAPADRKTVFDALSNKAVEVTGIVYAADKLQPKSLPVALQIRSIEEKDCKKSK